MKRYVFLLIVVALVGLSIPVESLFSETASSGFNAMYFRKFFQKTQPKEYYDFPVFAQRVFYPDSSVVYLNYQVVDDFSKPNSWGIISPSDQFSNPTKNTTPIADTDLLHWRTFQRSDTESMLLPPVDRSKSLKQSPPSVMGVRSFFLSNGSKVIKLYPKEDMFLPAYNIHFIEFWVFSIDTPYDIYITLQDYNGMLHKIYAGNMQHFGWKRIRAPFDDSKLNVVPPTLMYTRAVESRLKVVSISFESQNSMDTAGFFGAWLGDFGVTFSTKLRIPDSLSSPAAKLSTSFDWNEPENQSRPAAADQGVTSSAGQ